MSRRNSSLEKKGRDSIQDAEKMVQDEVAKVMIRLHGLDWEKNGSIGLSEEEINNLEQRREDEGNKLSGQRVSNRLLDYAHILDLKRIIQDNWSDFASIFPPKDTTMVYFDTLNIFRNPIAHIRRGVLEHQYYLVLGICGELVMYINRWRAGYRHHVKSYYCEFRFPATHPQDGQAEAAGRALEWSKKIVSLSSKTAELRSSEEFGEEKLIRLSKGNVKISNPQTIPQSGGIYWTSVIQARVSTKSALNEILTKGEHPCWALHWTLKEDVNVHTLVPEIRELTGLAPSSSSGLGTGMIASAEYTLEVDNQRIRIFLAGGDFGRMSSAVGLMPGSSGDKGFYRAHEIFSPDSILSFLRGEIGRQEFRTMLQQASVSSFFKDNA